MNVNDPRIQLILSGLRATRRGFAEWDVERAALMYGMAVGAVEGLFKDKAISNLEADTLRRDLRQALDQAHHDGFSRFNELIGWPASDVHCTGHVDYDPASRKPGDGA
jgi:hypothetical protein